METKPEKKYQGAFISGILSKAHRAKIEELVTKLNLPITSIVGIAIDNEFSRENPFELDVSFPEEVYEDYTFVAQAGLILKWMKENGGGPLERLILYRHDMGIEDRKEFLLAFREAYSKNLIRSYTPVQPVNVKHKYAEDYVFYEFNDPYEPAKKRKKKKTKAERDAEDYVEYLNLKKKFDGK